jgi:ribosomal protein S18 acetylase RimI-like enzyme
MEAGRTYSRGFEHILKGTTEDASDMSEPQTLRFECDTRSVDWQDLVSLFRLAKLGGREGDKVRRAFENSTVVCFAFEGSKLIGAARALSDREYHATVYDVAVHPEYQGRGIGSRMMKELIAMLPVWRILLVAEGHAREFYRRLGFEPFGDVMGRFDDAKLFDTD